MLNYEILKIKLKSIISCIKDYTNEPSISYTCNELENKLEKCNMNYDVLNYCCRKIYEWYKNNFEKIYNNRYVLNKDVHEDNIKELEEILENININQNKYEILFSKEKTKKDDLMISKSDIFIVHGHDSGLKNEVARFLENLGLNPIILHEQANKGNTIIEKIEEFSNVGFGIVLYTPCDKGGLAEKNDLRYRARQNVVFEHGYLIGKLGRKKVCALVKEDVEKPNDISGVVYISYDESGGWKLEIAKELKAAGYKVDFNMLF